MCCGQSARLLSLALAIACLAYVERQASAAAFVRGAYYRLGEDDPGAVAGAIGNDPTGDSFGDQLHLSRFGLPRYSANVPAQGPYGDTLSMMFANEGLGGPAFPGVYGRESSLSMIEQGYALEAWVMAGPTYLDSIQNSLVAYNGNPENNGFGLFLHSENYVARVGGFERKLGPATVGKWHHLAYVQSLGTVGYYFDGKLVAETTNDPLPSVASGGFWLGGMGDVTSAGSYLFNGWIDEVRYQSFNPLSAGGFNPTAFLIGAPNPEEKAWGVDASGNASVGTNWLGGVAPNGVGDAAMLGSVITDARVVTLDQPLTLGRLRFSDDNAYTIAGAKTLTLQAGMSANAVVQVQDSGGAPQHTMTAPIYIATDLDLVVDGGGLIVSGLLDNSAGNTITKSGSGPVLLRENTMWGEGSELVVQSGVLAIGASGSSSRVVAVHSLSILGDSRLDLNDNDLIVRATAGTKDAVHDAIEADIKSAQNGLDAGLITNWDGPGITSSTARTNNVGQGFDLTGLGVIRNSDLDVTTGIPGSSYTTFSGQAVTPDDVLVKYTYIGDANLSGAVSFDDYVGMDNAFFTLIPNLGWATGDINFDGVVNFDDYSKVDQAYFFQGAPLTHTDVFAVPEPSTWAPAILACLGVISMLHARNRCPEPGKLHGGVLFTGSQRAVG